MLVRLILFVFLLAALALAFASFMVALRSTVTLARDATGENMPKTVRTIAYVALMILMFGVALGWIGGV